MGAEAARPRVLIVDDELGVRESLRAILDGDCDVVTAGSGDEALALAERTPIDVVTLDLRMPGMGGITVLERLKRIDADVEVLIITGYGSFDTAVQGLRFRAFDYLSKPFDVERVRHLVQAALARRVAVRHMKAAPEQLLGTLSHEFRTPLNVIMGYSNMLREEAEGTLSEEQRLALERIQANSSSLLTYVETLFYMAELDRGMVPVAVTSASVASLLGRVRDELGPRAAAKGIMLVVDAPAGLTVGTDEDKIVRLLRALVDNAIRYTPSGEVVLQATAASGGVALEVRDAGPGIAPELIAETELVLAGPSPTSPRLLGFGLRLAGRLVRTLGARLAFETTATGTTVRVHVPSLVQSDGARIAPAA